VNFRPLAGQGKVCPACGSVLPHRVDPEGDRIKDAVQVGDFAFTLPHHSGIGEICTRSQVGLEGKADASAMVLWDVFDEIVGRMGNLARDLQSRSGFDHHAKLNAVGCLGEKNFVLVGVLAPSLENVDDVSFLVEEPNVLNLSTESLVLTRAFGFEVRVEAAKLSGFVLASGFSRFVLSRRRSGFVENSYFLHQ
jgi:hypothetical protein